MHSDNKDRDASFDIIHKDMSKDGLKLSFRLNRQYPLAKDEYTATANDNFKALALTVRDRLVERWIETHQRYHKQNVKRVYYLSMEFLIGRLLWHYACNLGLEKQIGEACKELGLDLIELRDQEPDAGLGNGGLGRLAACFLDSMATLGIPGYGYGIRYEYGIFRQKIENGFQIEIPDEWLRWGCPWEMPRPEYTVKVRFYGRVHTARDGNGKPRISWDSTQDVMAVPYDVPIPGYKNNVVNTLRLWSARSSEEFDFDYFKNGDYEQAVYKKIFSENISKVLYPNDNNSQGKELRLKQEYFFTAASISDIIRRYLISNTDFFKFPEKVAIQLNDTHPALAVVELMRVFVDERGFEWDAAWDIVQKTVAYTNHTLMPEALECWSTELLERVLPRHLQIIYEINSRFLREVANWAPGDADILRRMSLVVEEQPKKVRMAHVAIIGSHSVNGVSALHSKLLKEKMFPDFDRFYNGKRFNNKTNGISPRVWLLKSNPGLSGLITETIGDGWVTNLDTIEELLPHSGDENFRRRWWDIRQANKRELARYIQRKHNITVNPNSLFDVQVKRVHEYKRQLMFAYYIISRYLTIKHNPGAAIVPRTFILGGKAAPGYFTAKLIIKFINSVADIINRDKSVGDKLKVVFLEDYRVSLAAKIFPASDLSEQISTAGFEASGTGNMKFMLNGALTIGTMDGANIEISELVGPENMFIFGLRDDEVEQLRRRGYHPQDTINASPMLKEIYSLMAGNFFEPGRPGLFQPLIQLTTVGDSFMVCADFESYCQAQAKAEAAYKDREEWIKKSILNTAKSGKFSSDRTIREYARDIWNINVQ